MPTTIALDAMGSDRAPKPEVEGAILAARHYDVEVLLVGKEDVVRAELDLHRVLAQALHPHRQCSRSHRHAREGGAGGAHQARLLPARRTAPGARRQGGRICHRRQYRRGHGDRQDGPGRDPRRGPSCAGGGISHRARHGHHPHRRRRQCRFQAAKPAAVRHHGRYLLPQHFWRQVSQRRASARRLAFHRRGREQGQRAYPRSLQADSESCR